MKSAKVYNNWLHQQRIWNLPKLNLTILQRKLLCQRKVLNLTTNIDKVCHNKLCFRPYKLCIFWKLLVQKCQKWYYQVSHTQTQKTQIYKNHKCTHAAFNKVPERPNILICGVFLKRRLFQDIKNDVPNCSYVSTRKCSNISFVWFLLQLERKAEN